MAGHPTR
ncbi:hypothetical protein ECFDA506_2252, partial [Escherichia coli FDA506]